MPKISIEAETRAHIEDADPQIKVNNFNKGKLLPGRSWMIVFYKEIGEYSNSGIKLFLDYASAKALAEGILANLGEMKYREEVKTK